MASLIILQKEQKNRISSIQEPPLQIHPVVVVVVAVGTSHFSGSNGGSNNPTPDNQNKVIENKDVTAPGVTHGNIQQKEQGTIQEHINTQIHNYYIPIQN